MSFGWKPFGRQTFGLQSIVMTWQQTQSQLTKWWVRSCVEQTSSRTNVSRSNNSRRKDVEPLNGATTLSMMTFNIMTLSITAFSKTIDKTRHLA